MEIVLHPQLLVPKRGREAQQPVLYFVAGSAQIQVHVQWVEASVDGVELGPERRRGRDSADV